MEKSGSLSAGSDSQKKYYPGMEVSEAEKFADGGKYFMDMCKYYASFYNAFEVASSFDGVLPKSMVEEMMENIKFYYGFQDNAVFGSLTKTTEGSDIPAVWINGQKIRQLVDHIKGNVIQMAEPIGKSIAANSISKDAVKKQKDVFEKIDFAHELSEMIGDLPASDIAFAPAGKVDYSDPFKVRKLKEEYRKKFEKTGTVLARSIYFSNNAKQQFINDGVYQAIANLNMCEIKIENGRLVMNEIPPYYAVYDFNSHDDDNHDFAGYIIPRTYEDVLRRYPHLEELKNDYNKIKTNPETFTDFMDSCNLGFNNMLWVYPDRKRVSEAVIYWLAPADTRFRSKVNAYGKKNYKKIKDHARYDDKMGYEIKGDFSAYMVHYAVVVAGKYLARYGYEPYQVRSYIANEKPSLPILTYCHEKKAGYVRSIVSRLKANQIELDRLAYKIQELTSSDLGHVKFVRGDKLNENINVKNIVDDLKQFKITVIPPSGDESSDSIRDIVMGEDITNNQYIVTYLRLKQEQREEMEAIVSIPPAALGMQRSVIGKGVQENTISQSTLAMLGFYEGLSEYWRKKMQYAINKYKLFISDKPGEYILPVNSSEMEVINITRDFRYEDLYVYVTPNNAIDNEHAAIFNQMLHAYSQNVNNPLAAAQGLLNGIKLLRYNSFGEGIEQLEEHVQELIRKQQEDLQQQQVFMAQQEQFKNQSKLVADQQQQISELIKLMTKINLEGAWKVKEQEVKNGMKESRDEAVIDSAIQQTMAN